MRCWVLLPLFLLSAVCPAIAQPCAPVRFRSAAEGSFGYRSPKSTGAGLERNADGSFKRREYYLLQAGLSANVLEVGPVTEHYEHEMYRCSGFPAPERHAAAGPDFSVDRPGLSSSEYALADVTGDGRMSLVAIERRVARDSVIVGVGTASFGLAGDFKAYPTGAGPEEVVVADFTGDGRRDLAVTFSGPTDRSSPGGVSLSINNGDGTFKPAIDTTFGNFAYQAAAGDWNGDGKLDLAVTQSQPLSVVLMYGNGDGRFQAPTQIFDHALPTLISGDVNNDSRLDLIGADAKGFVYFPGATAGGLGSAVTVDLGLSGPYSVVLGDFNGDSRMDVAEGGLSGQYVAVALSSGNGRFASPRRYLVGRDPIDLQAIDFDGDGKLDVVVAGGHPARLGPNSEGGQIAALRGRGDGTFLGAQMIGGDQPSGVAAGDFNRDGADDLAIPVRGGLEIWLSDGAGTFNAPAVIAIAGSNSPGGAAVADLNRDGSPDVILADGGSRVLALRGRGDGSFDSATAQTAPSEVSRVVTGDFDGNGRLDVAAAGQSGAAVFLSNADGSLGAARNLALPGPFRATGLTAGDFNKDGRADLAVADEGDLQNRDGKVATFLATGGGAFAAAKTYAVEKYPHGVLATDLNGDGAVDLAVTTSGAGFRDYLVTFLGDGAGGLAPDVSRTTEFGPGEMAHADLNMDGRPELLVAHCCGQTDPSYLLNEGAGLYQPEVGFFAGPSPYSFAVGDFNRDGMPDLAFQSSGNPPAGVSVLINASARAAGPVHVSAASFLEGPLAAGMLATAFGSGFAGGRESATSTPLPTMLAGSRVALVDSAGVRREAGLIFMDPAQVNYHVPGETALGEAVISIEPGGGPSQQTTVQIDRIAPGLFFLNGQRLAAATLLRVTLTGEQIFEQVYEVDGQGAVQPRVIDLGPQGERLFLVAYGTGFRGRSSLSQVKLIVDGIEHPVLYAGEQGEFVGLDQANAELRRDLAGRGDVELRLNVEGRLSNAVRLKFR